MASLNRDLLRGCPGYRITKRALQILPMPVKIRTDGQVLSAVYTELRGNIVYAFEDRLFFLTTSFELFIEIYNLLEQEDTVQRDPFCIILLLL